MALILSLFLKKKFLHNFGVLAVSSFFSKGSGKQAGCPTKRAPDVWDSAAFSGIFLASSFPYSQTESTPAHTQVTQTVGRSLAQQNQENKPMKKLDNFVLLAFILLIPTLFGCVPTSTPIQSTVTPEFTLTPTPTVTASATPEPLMTEVIDNLNFEERKAFAIALDVEKDARRGDNPIVYTGQVHKLDSEKNYVDPITGDFLPVDNGTTAKEQTIDNTVPVAFDDEGFAHVFYNGEWRRLEGSQNIQFDQFENFNWPNTKIANPETLKENEQDLIGLTIPEAIFKKKDGFKRSMAPIFFLEKKVGQAIVYGIRLKPTIHGFILNQNDPYSAQLAIIIDDTAFYGNDMVVDYIGAGFSSKFFENIKLNTLYYIMYETDQKASFARTYPGSADEVTNNYSGLVPSSQTGKVITGELSSDNVIIINGLASRIVEPGKE